VRVLVVGEFKQGKSQLVNSLVSAPVCPVDDDVATSVVTMVRHADTPSVALVRVARRQRHAERTEVPLGELAAYVSEAGTRATGPACATRDVGIPRTLLAGGLVLVDTPGVGGLGSAHGAATTAALASADAVVMVSAAAQEYTRPELDFLAAAVRMCPNVVCVLTKTDLYPHWRRIAELDRGHLGGRRHHRRPHPGVVGRPPGGVAHQEQAAQRGVRLPGAHPVPPRGRAGPGGPADRRSTAPRTFSTCAGS
jgi:hypothetical protein